jgi:dCTP deaminase
MILSDREIRLALERGWVKLTPIPPDELWSSTAIDLRLDAQLRRWVDTPGGVCFRPGSVDFSFSEVIQKHSESMDVSEKGYVLPPQGFILGWTVEKIQLPYSSRLCARVEGKSSLARLGLGVHITAPTIHSGFGEAAPEGIPLQLEIWNVGPLPIELIRYMPICQIIFEEVHGTPEKGYRGQFGVQGPRLG